LEAFPTVFVKLHQIHKNKVASPTKPNEIPKQLKMRGERITLWTSPSSLSSKVFSKLPH